MNCSVQILWEDAGTRKQQTFKLQQLCLKPHCSILPAAQFCLITSEGMCFICFSPVFLITCCTELYLLSDGSYYPFPIVYIIILLVPFLFSSNNTMGNTSDISGNSIYHKTEKNPTNTAKFCIPAQNYWVHILCLLTLSLSKILARINC